MTIEDIPASIITGVVCGILGAFFVWTNSHMGALRKKLITKEWMRPLETAFFAFATTTVFYWAAKF